MINFELQFNLPLLLPHLPVEHGRILQVALELPESEEIARYFVLRLGHAFARIRFVVLGGKVLQREKKMKMKYSTTKW